MDNIFQKVKDSVVDHALNRGDSDNNRGGNGPQGYDRSELGHSSRDTRGYPHDEAGGGGGGGGGGNYDERQGFGGHGGRPGSARAEEGRYDASGREYRPAQGSGGYGFDGDYGAAREYAEQSSSSGDSSLFASAISMLRGREKDLEGDEVDEREFTRNHRELYDEGGRGEKSSQSLGQAAALQALKRFTGGGGSTGSSSSSSLGKDQNAFIGMAMAEAVKLFDSQKSQGNVAPGETKQDVVSSAAQMALKLFLKSRFDAGSGGGSSGLFSLASKFLK